MTIVATSLLPVVWLFVLVSVLLLILLKWKLPGWIAGLIGRRGEEFVSGVLSNLDPLKYTVLNDLMLPSEGSIGTTQIDHVVVSNYGIFVVETKSYTGWIFGNAYQPYWTQVIYRHRERFFNPLRQNYTHIKAVEALIWPILPTVRAIGYVAFPDAGKLQISGTDAVGHARDVLQRILLQVRQDVVLGKTNTAADFHKWDESTLLKAAHSRCRNSKESRDLCDRQQLDFRA
jgi:Nuclease-related domain